MQRDPMQRNPMQRDPMQGNPMQGNLRVLVIQHQDDCPPGYVGDRLRQHGADIDVLRAGDGELPAATDYDLIVPLGSDDSAYDDSLPYLPHEWKLLDEAVTHEVPVFGICFGAQLLSRVLGGQVHRSPTGPEIGWLDVDTRDPQLVEPGPWLSWHLDVMAGPPPDGTEIAATPVGTHAFVHGNRVGVQFHPEARPESAEIWARHYRGSLDELGLEYDALMDQTRRLQPAAEHRAHVLTDRVLHRLYAGAQR